MAVLTIRTYPATDSQIPLCRHAARETVAGHRTFDPDTVGLLLTELATNAVKHSSSPAFTVAVALTERARLLVAVVDGGHGEPKPHIRDAGLSATGGRGLVLVEALAHRWGVDQEGGGMLVWFELAPEAERAKECASVAGVSGQ
ncbi:ATP-binding protein [Streptomyces cupreus]|nr:ATP-binding protein [Streptomyces cupreus]